MQTQWMDDGEAQSNDCLYAPAERRVFVLSITSQYTYQTK